MDRKEYPNYYSLSTLKSECRLGLDGDAAADKIAEKPKVPALCGNSVVRHEIQVLLKVYTNAWPLSVSVRHSGGLRRQYFLMNFFHNEFLFFIYLLKCSFQIPSGNKTI